MFCFLKNPVQFHWFMRALDARHLEHRGRPDADNTGRVINCPAFDRFAHIRAKGFSAQSSRPRCRLPLPRFLRKQRHQRADDLPSQDRALAHGPYPFWRGVRVSVHRKPPGNQSPARSR
jgi:hypothetical protein